MKSPLSVVLISQGDAADTEPYVKSLKRAFLGMDSRDLNAAPDYEWLHPLDFRAFSYTKENQKNGDEVRKVLAPNGVTEDIVGSSERVLVVVLLGKANGDDATELASSWRKLADAEDHVSVLFVSLSSDQVPEAVGEARWGKIEALGLKELDERDLRQDLLTLHTMQMAICLLFKKVRTVPGNSRGVRPKRPKIFFSHAKKDGVPLAKSVKNWLKGLKGFKSFYDTDDLDLTGDISKQLKSAVAGSIVVALRTEVYDSRYWCQKEVYWAEMYNRPLVTVDARWNVQHGPAVIGLDGSPSVRIPDGSITRILLAAMKEGLRIGLFDSRVELAAVQNGNRVKYEKISRYPTLASLAGAIERLNKGKTRAPGFLVYPNPALPDDVEIIAKDVAKKCERE
ncbi:hypothetical protein [Verrucomicrobium sp. BvORR106]|uniref:hypothetical protein n=1 Tax=Verrucomicrobium sp. BvORR106 TaxID=1403819 RepID=UPI000AA0C86F|nr:hypothetical protein [Verrucomicrobium sp. BvORR106]